MLPLCFAVTLQTQPHGAKTAQALQDVFPAYSLRRSNCSRYNGRTRRCLLCGNILDPVGHHSLQNELPVFTCHCLAPYDSSLETLKTVLFSAQTLLFLFIKKPNGSLMVDILARLFLFVKQIFQDLTILSQLCIVL